MVSLLSGAVPISQVQGRYFIHSAAHASHVRQTHHITGVLAGNLPQAPQQNVFLGLPLQLMPEEARLLVEKGAAYIVDDATLHKNAFLENGLSEEERRRFRDLMDKQGSDLSDAHAQRSEARKESALRKIASKQKTQMGGETGEGSVGEGTVGNGDMNNWNDMPEGMLAPRSRTASSRTKSRRRGAERSASSSVGPASRDVSTGPPGSGSQTPASGMSRPPGPPRAISRDEGRPVGPPRSLSVQDGPPSRGRETSDESGETGKGQEESLFDSGPSKQDKQGPGRKNDQHYLQHTITPSTSYPPLVARPPNGQNASELPEAPSSYAVYKHLHDKGYFLSPGLRFGCQYMAYPGDPLRYHSHFLVNGKEWHEDFDLMEVVAGGRLGTGVKKAFVLGGNEEKGQRTDSVDAMQNSVEKLSLGDDQSQGDGDGVRTFTIEWAGM